tara:strand:+ start:181 stop:438 length:258 start_codon:yes stop_codon:yes gene_type:complete
MDNIINFVGLLGSIGIGLSLIPQTCKTINSNESSLSIPFIVIILLSSIFMVIYAIYFLIVPMLVANSSVLINSLILLFFSIKQKN